MLTVAVVGTGAMGRGIIQWAAEAGAKVIAFDQRGGAAAEACNFVSDMFGRAVSKGRMTTEQRHDAMERIQIADELAELAASDIVVEAILEDLKAKRDLFIALEQVVSDNAILCTNTSSLSVTSCATGCRVPQRVAGLHFFNPVPLMKVVEIIKGELTAQTVIDRLLDFVATTSHHPAVCADTPGFVVNHAGRGLVTEGLRIVQEGVATFADVDRVMRESAGFAMGPFELFDLTGLDVSSRVLREIYDAYFQDPRYRPSPLVYRRVEAGLLGRKAGRGFYQYDNGRKVEPDEQHCDLEANGTVFVDPTSSSIEAVLSKLLTAGGLTKANSADEATAVVLAPYGLDATTAALAAGYDPTKVVAIDPLHLETYRDGGRLTLMPTPATGSATGIVHAALLKAGAKVTRISDSPGFIAQRTIATIVNIACEIAQQRVAVPSDIDAGVRLGLGYPKGPLSLGDSIGPVRIVQILLRLLEQTGDPRYRPSLWLRRRAALNISLTTAE